MAMVCMHQQFQHPFSSSYSFFFGYVCVLIYELLTGPQGLLIEGGNLYDNADFAFTSLCLP
jgi:hypothetical protein